MNLSWDCVGVVQCYSLASRSLAVTNLKGSLIDGDKRYLEETMKRVQGFVDSRGLGGKQPKSKSLGGSSTCEVKRESTSFDLLHEFLGNSICALSEGGERKGRHYGYGMDGDIVICNLAFWKFSRRKREGLMEYKESKKIDKYLYMKVKGNVFKKAREKTLSNHFETSVRRTKRARKESLLLRRNTFYVLQHRNGHPSVLSVLKLFAGSGESAATMIIEMGFMTIALLSIL
ncbi:hypothetical protein Dimus_007370 [Dionaea muscipula]